MITDIDKNKSAAVVSSTVSDGKNHDSSLEGSAFGKFVKEQLVKNGILTEVIGYGTNTEVRLKKYHDRIIAEKLCRDCRVDLSIECKISKKLASNPEMNGWFIPVYDRFKKYEERVLLGHKGVIFLGWAVHMEAVLTGSLADIVTENMCNKLRGEGVKEPSYEYSEYALPTVAIEHSVSRFYLANAALVISKIHESGVAWLDVKSENFLVDDAGFLVACDFGRSDYLNEENANDYKNKDWKDLGRRIGDYALRIPLSDNPLQKAVKSLKSGYVHSLDDFKKLDLFSDFNWLDLERKKLETPCVEIRQKLLSKHWL